RGRKLDLLLLEAVSRQERGEETAEEHCDDAGAHANLHSSGVRGSGTPGAGSGIEWSCELDMGRISKVAQGGREADPTRTTRFSGPVDGQSAGGAMAARGGGGNGARSGAHHRCGQRQVPALPGDGGGPGGEAGAARS